MATLGMIEYDDASPEVRAVYDDIMATRKTDWINNFWKALAHDPATLAAHLAKRERDHGARRAGCPHQGNDLHGGERHQPMRLLHCIPHRGGSQSRNEDAMLSEVMAVVGMANESNRLASGYQVEIDEQFLVKQVERVTVTEKITAATALAEV